MQISLPRATVRGNRCELQQGGRSDFKEARQHPNALYAASRSHLTITAASWLNWAPTVCLALQRFPMTLRRHLNSPFGLQGPYWLHTPPLSCNHTGLHSSNTPEPLLPGCLALLSLPSGTVLPWIFPWLMAAQMLPPPEGPLCSITLFYIILFPWLLSSTFHL